MERSVAFYFPMMLTVGGILLYHIAQKTMPPAVSPFVPLTAAFSIATILCLLFFLLSTRRTLFGLWHDISWSIALGFAVVMIEAGYLTAYRLGWKLNRAALTSNVVVAILLIPLGPFFSKNTCRFGWGFILHQRTDSVP